MTLIRSVIVTLVFVAAILVVATSSWSIASVVVLETGS
jgi:hypothetical protein